MNSLLLSPSTWDLTKDASGNIALAGDPYAIAQNAASALRTWLGEDWYNTTLGVPYQQILGQPANLQLLKAKLIAVALTVPGVATAQVFITSIVDRNVRGQVQVTSSDGTVTAAAF